MVNKGEISVQLCLYVTGRSLRFICEAARYSSDVHIVFVLPQLSFENLKISIEEILSKQVTYDIPVVLETVLIWIPISGGWILLYSPDSYFHVWFNCIRISWSIKKLLFCLPHVFFYWFQLDFAGFTHKHCTIYIFDANCWFDLLYVGFC